MPGRVSRGRYLFSPIEEWPNASNTGVPAGTSLTAYSGPATINTDNTVIDSKLITDCLVIGADNVTITKSKFESNGCSWQLLNDWNSGATGLLVEDCEFDALGNTTGDACININNAIIRRCNIHGTYDCVKFGNDLLFEDNYVHDPLIFGPDPHADGMQTLNANTTTIRHNTIIMPIDATSCIINGPADELVNLTIENNLFAGANWVLYGGSPGTPTITNVQIINNWVSTQIVSTGGGSGVFTDVEPPIVISGNRWFDGPNAGQLIT